VILLHGAALPAELCWRAQLPLADRFTLEIVDRAGYGLSQAISPGEDLDADARLVPELLGDGAHVVGHSSGAVAAMLAAARAPERVLSLTLCEPPAFQLIPESEAGQRMAREAEEHLQRAGDDAAWLHGFGAIFGRTSGPVGDLPSALVQGVSAVRAVRRRPWEVELPIRQLASARFPKLVVSGDHNPVFEAICDTLAASLRGERAHIVGAGHATPDTGDLFNEALEAFIRTSRS
jgi:pimeloyl-ACP methyl ester carboxylesterase